MRVLAPLVFGASADCSTATDPTVCVNTTGCAWLMLEGECHHSLGTVAQQAPLSCCASSDPESQCYHRNGTLPDGSCALDDALPTDSFSLSHTQRMLHLAGAAYCSSSEVTSWACGQHCEAISGITDISFIDHPSQVLTAFVAYDAVQESAVVSFRGTVSTSITDWAHDLSFTKTKPIAQYPNAAVHHGFWDAWKDLEADVLVPLKAVLAKYGTNDVQVTGHSMGASIATDAAIDLKLTYGYNVAMVNFGSPRTGDRNFEAALTAEVPSTWRITHHHDLVPHVPPEAFGFYHSTTEVFFPAVDSSNLTYVVCDGTGEDPACSDICANSLSCTSVTDHLNYLGFVLGGDNCASAGTVLV